MCFNISIAKKKKALEKRFKSEFKPDSLFDQEYFLSVFTKPKVPVITNTNPNVIETFKWGLIPHWVKNEETAENISTKTFNSRVETASEKPSFRDALKSNRCLVLSDGFFEWQTRGKIKVPHYIYKKDNEPFAYAGLWNEWLNKETGEIHNTFSILTQDANPFMATMHNTKKRQPIILTKELEQVWLNSTNNSKKLAEEIAGSCFNVDLKSHTIDKSFRSFGNSSEVIKPVQFGFELF